MRMAIVAERNNRSRHFASLAPWARYLKVAPQ